MKDLFVNNTGKHLIEDKGFSIADTSSIPALLSKYTFFKDKWGTMNFVNFIDADIINFNYVDDVKGLCYKELDIFKSNSNNGILIYFKIFVASSRLPDETTDQILSFYKHFVLKKAYFIPVIIDLSSGSVTTAFKRSIDKVGLIDILQYSLNDRENLDTFYDLEEAQKKLEPGLSSRKHMTPYVTYLIIAINIIIFIIMTLSGGTENLNVLTKFGAKVNSLILKGQYWRFLASAFVHIGLPHIVFNMYGLYNMGALVENLYGHLNYLFLYLVAALAGSISSFIFSTALSAGASGAIFGLFGALLYFGQKKPRIFSTSFGINILVVLGFNLIYGFTNSGIDNFAHIGGLIGGYLAANIVGFQSEKKLNLKKAAVFVLTLIILISGVFVGINKNTSSWEYYLGLGADSYAAGDFQKSREQLEKAVSINPNSGDAHALLSLVYYNSGNEELGKEEFDSAVNINKNQPDLYFNLGNFFFNEKNYEEAENMFERFVEIEPKRYEGYLNLGVAQNMQGKLNEAELSLKKSVEIAPDEFLANANLGYLYLDKGDLDSSKVYLEKSAKIDPNNQDVKKTLDYINSKIKGSV